MKTVFKIVLMLVVALVLVACVSTKKNAYELVKDPESGLSYGVRSNGKFVTDASMFRNNKLKIRIRNTTGDPDLDFHSYRTQLENAYRELGYPITRGSDFGILMDINIDYFGQATDMLPQEYTYLGAAAGGVAGSAMGIQKGLGADALTGGMAGMVAGAALTEILRNYATEETFIILSSVTLSTVMPDHTEDELTISFVTGKKLKEKKNNFRGFRSSETVNLGVYAGGRMIDKGDVMAEVRKRYMRILKNII